VNAPAFQATFTATIAKSEDSKDKATKGPVAPFPTACVRAWQPGDRVEILHSRGPKKVKEVLNQLHIAGEERVTWPVVVWMGRIIWMRGVKLANSPQGHQHRIDGENEAPPESNLDIRETPNSP
jgi:tRNA(Ile)-lysidine synthetase-like protein